MRLRLRALLVPWVLAAASGAMAGTVAVSFVNPGHYTDAGTSSWDEDANLKAIAAHLQGLGQRYLPPDQTLKIEVLDVDLAGTVRPARDGSLFRILKGRADWPRIKLRYALERAGAAGPSGEEWVSDLDYTHGLPTYRRAESLYYEKRMLDAWFKARFAQGAAGPG